ncbi:MAG: hypothetical protein JST27_10765 [Bacteroidetes bacterium]|nr:hypothetical protein [Bacteroidota bacterium]
MRNRFWNYALFGILFPLSCLAQESGEQQITIPSSPAFSILSFEPAAVMKPSSNKDLATDVLSAFDPQGKLLMNLGLECSPYWLASRPTLSQKEYLNPDPGQAFLQSLSFSAATVRDSAKGANKLGAGFRFRILNGQPIDSLAIVQKELTQYELLQSLISTAKVLTGVQLKTRQQAQDWVLTQCSTQQINSMLSGQFREEAEAIIQNFQDQPQDIRKMLDELKLRLMTRNQALKKNLSRLLYQRKGFVLEFAGASGFNTTQQYAWEKIGLWATASYYVSRSDLFSASARYMNRNSDTAKAHFDLGFAYLKEGSRYNLSLEGMLRWYWLQVPVIQGTEHFYKKENGFSYRLAAQVSYLLMKDISVNLSLGKDFDDEPLTSSGFFSILGVNYSLFARPIIE